MPETKKSTEPNLVNTLDVIHRFRENCNDIAEKLHKSPEVLKEQMAALAILIYEAKTRGDNKFIIAFNEHDLPVIKGYNDSRPIV